MTALTDSPDRQALAHETATQLRTALATLPPEQARAVVAAAHGLTAPEIADAENIPVGTAKSRIYAALNKLHAVVPSPRADHD
jgi:RNA polymerase sigma-70 factor (ECF subfamily)